VDGRDYRFISRADFDRLVEDGAFLEWAEIYGDHRSGTLLGPVAEDLESGRDVVLEVDVQGAAAIRDRVADAVLVFLVPPSRDELERRLRARRTETDAQLERRLAAVDAELEQASWFDHVVVNDDADRAAAEVAAILDAHRAGA
jgi:guanylate kinase